MINFFDEFESRFKLSISKNQANFKVVYLPSGVYLEGHQGVLKLEKDEISLKLKGGFITFFGDKLFIKMLEVDCCVISGEIKKIERS